MFDLVILGGGIHGTILQLAILRGGKRSPVVIDQESEPLAVWKRNTAACGMRYLRSSSSHNIELDFRALRRFAARRGYGEEHFIAPHMRPSLELFNAHADHLITANRLDDRLTDRIERIEKRGDHFLLTGARDAYRAKTVLLSPGTPTPGAPWTQERASSSGRAIHLFDHRFSLEEVRPEESVAVVGCGVSGGQLAASLLQRGLKTVTLIDLKEPAQADYDGNPCYVGPKCSVTFEKLASAEERRRIIAQERYPGTLPRDIYTEIRALTEAEAIEFILGRVVDARERGNRVEVELIHTGSRQDRETRLFDRVIATTGFIAGPPAAELLAPLAEAHGLPRGPLGYPYPDTHLSWTEELFLAGSVAELRIGPPARNIIGAHLAARRILPLL